MIKPNPETVNSYLQKWDTSDRLENYRLQERSLALLFNQFCPGNTKLEYVLLKVTALNQFYSINIFDTYSVAKHILKMDIDQRLKSHDRLLVNELALITIKEKQKTSTRLLQNIAATTFQKHFLFTIHLLKRCFCIISARMALLCLRGQT